MEAEAENRTGWLKMMGFGLSDKRRWGGPEPLPQNALRACVLNHAEEALKRTSTWGHQEAETQESAAPGGRKVKAEWGAPSPHPGSLG